jgi:enoyl-CoA hydratase/carnithine racemase
MDYTQIQYEVANNILLITLNRPEKLNAFTDFVMAPELIDAFDRADADDDVRVVIVTGAGRGFCSGKDLDVDFDYEEQAQATQETHRDIGGKVALRIYEMKKPVIAAINGPAIGVGVTMTLPMDIRLASERARFGFVFARLGIAIESCSSWFLPRIIGPSRAAEWTYTGRIFDAKEALEGGLVSQVLPYEQLMEKAIEIAREIAENTSAVSVLLNRRLLGEGLGMTHPREAHEVESQYIYWLGTQPDSKDATKAFKEKRRPKFTMKVSGYVPNFFSW